MPEKPLKIGESFDPYKDENGDVDPTKFLEALRKALADQEEPGTEAFERERQVGGRKVLLEREERDRDMLDRHDRGEPV